MSEDTANMYLIQSVNSAEAEKPRLVGGTKTQQEELGCCGGGPGQTGQEHPPGWGRKKTGDGLWRQRRWGREVGCGGRGTQEEVSRTIPRFRICQQ